MYNTGFQCIINYNNKMNIYSFKYSNPQIRVFNT